MKPDDAVAFVSSYLSTHETASISCPEDESQRTIIDDTILLSVGEQVVMPSTEQVNVATHVIGLDRKLQAKQHVDQPDPGVSVDDLVFGIANMSENSPPGGEVHADGDEVLYLVSGKLRLVCLDGEDPDTDIEPGDAVIVPRGRWHRADVLESCHIVYLTPGTGNQVRRLSDSAGAIP